MLIAASICFWLSAHDAPGGRQSGHTPELTKYTKNGVRDAECFEPNMHTRYCRVVLILLPSASVLFGREGREWVRGRGGVLEPLTNIYAGLVAVTILVGCLLPKSMERDIGDCTTRRVYLPINIPHHQ